MRNKKSVKFMPAVLMVAVMVMIMLPMGFKSVKAAPTGSGTKDDPLIVDNFTDLKAALESDKDTYIVVNEFANTEGKDYYELRSGIDYDNSDYGHGVIQPSGYKNLVVNDCRIDCRGNNVDKFLIYNYGELDISGAGTLTVNNLSGVIFNSKGKVTVDGDITIEANPTSGINHNVVAISSAQGMLEIKNGTFVGGAKQLTGMSAAISSYQDFNLSVLGGNFKCNVLKADVSKCSLYISSSDKVALKGGTFEGIYSVDIINNKTLSDYLDAGCKYAYSKELSSGQIVQEIGDKAGETKIDGTVRVGIPVTAADITITEPVVGASPDFTGSTGTGYKTSVEWLIGNDKTKKLSATDKFEGRDYVALVKLTAEDGYILDGESLKQNITINGATINSFNCNSECSSGSTVVPFQLSYSEVSATITEPVAGQSPDYTAVVTDEGYSAKVTQWTEYQADTQTDKVMSATDKFAEGKGYSAIVEISANEGYAFDVTKCTINGKEVALYNTNTANVLYYKVDYVIEKLYSGEIYCTITEPEIGETPDYTVFSGNDCFNIEIISWYRGDDETDVLLSTDTFKKGEKYTAKIKLTADKFTDLDTSDFQLMLNYNTIDEAAQVISISSKEAYFKFSFNLLVIDKVSINITEPQIGEGVDFTVTTDSSEYTADMTWYCYTDDVYPNAGDKFENGKVYKAEIYVNLPIGGKFDQGANFEILVNGTEPAYSDIYSRRIYIEVEYPFITISEILDDVSVTYNEPVIGKYPDYTVTTGDARYTAEITDWYLMDKYYHFPSVLDPSQKFEAGETYFANIRIIGTEGYGFDQSNTKLTVNGNLINQGYYNANWNIITCYTPEIMAKELTFSEILDDVSITYTEPVIGAYPDYTVTTGDTKYTAEMMWYILEHSNNGPSGYTTLDPSQKFEAGETYRAEFLVTGSEDYGFDASITKLTVNGNLIDPNSVYLYLNTMAFMGSGITAKEAVTVQDITITTAPAKITYTEGETFDQTGMVVTATYSDNSTATVTGYTVSPSTALTTTDTAIIISYTEDGVTKTVTQAITVNAKSNIENNNTENNNTENNNTENNNTSSNSGSTNSGSETGNNSGSTNTDNTNTGSNTGNYYNNTDTNNTNTGSGTGTNSGSINTGNTNTDNTNTGSNTGTNSGSTNNGNVNTGSNNGSNSGNTNSGSADTGNTAKDPKPTEIPDPVVTEVENKDGSKTKTTKEWSKDGTVTESKVTEYKNGDKSTSETVKDSTGKTVSTYTYSLTMTQKGNTVESIVDKKADGTLFKSTVTRYATGKITVDTTAKNKDDLKKIINTKITYDTVKNGQVKVTAVKTNDTAITIPGTIIVGEDSYTVYAIGKNAFKGNKTLETIIIEENINTVGANAFKGVKTLKNIYIYSKKLKTVGKNAFYGINENAKFYIKASKSNCKKFANKIKKAGFVGDISYKRITKKVKLS